MWINFHLFFAWIYYLNLLGVKVYVGPYVDLPEEHDSFWLILFIPLMSFFFLFFKTLCFEPHANLVKRYLSLFLMISIIFFFFRYIFIMNLR